MLELLNKPRGSSAWSSIIMPVATGAHCYQSRILILRIMPNVRSLEPYRVCSSSVKRSPDLAVSHAAFLAAPPSTLFALHSQMPPVRWISMGIFHCAGLAFLCCFVHWACPVQSVDDH